MKKNVFDQIELEEQDLFELIYKKDFDLDKIYVDQPTANTFNKSNNINNDKFSKINFLDQKDETIEEFDSRNQENWFMPDEYKNMDIEGFLVTQCPKQNYERLIIELQLFRKHNMMTLLRYLKYLVDTMRENNIVWGVGRGSSVASYCLFLIGVHKIDSIKYKLDIKEFIKN